MLNNISNSKMTIFQAMEKLSKSSEKYLIILNSKKKLIGTLVDGDIRRAILNKIKLNLPIDKIINKKPFYLVENKFDLNKLKNILIKKKISFVPIVSKNKKVISVISLTDLLTKKDTQVNLPNIPVVIMAGGEGTRLNPFTNILPKPLIPLNNKPVIEHIMNSFANYGSKSFYLTLNYKSKILKSYFKGNNSKQKISFIEEKEPLGTAGSLNIIKKKIDKFFFLSNADIILNIDYRDLYNFHKEKKSDITLVTATKEFEIPYGTCTINKNGNFGNITEKPKFIFFVNTGVYILNKSIISLIPKNRKMDMDQLIRIAKSKKKKIKAFPISGNDWIDVGQWSEYEKAINKFKFNK